MNLEMMKQLLQEFAEKEALTTEEIKAIQQQSQELELRIQKCRARLEKVSQDKHKIDEMRTRYAGTGNGARRSENFAGVTRSQAPAAPPPAPVAPAAKKAETTINPTEELEKKNDGFSSLQSVSHSALPPVPEAIPQPPPVPPPASPVPPLERLAASTMPHPSPGATPGSPPASNRQLAQFFDDIRPGNVTPTPPAPQVPQFNSAADILTTFESMSSSTPTLGELPPVPINQQLVLNEPAPAPDQAQPASASAPAAASEEESEEGPDETVKSINDALRGLFR